MKKQLASINPFFKKTGLKASDFYVINIWHDEVILQGSYSHDKMDKIGHLSSNIYNDDRTEFINVVIGNFKIVLT